MARLTNRTNEVELIDGDSLSDRDRLEALDQLPRVNRWLGGVRAILKELPAICGPYSANRSLRVLDVGCGVGDIPRAIARWSSDIGRPMTIVGLERDRPTLDLAIERCASAPEIVLLRGDGLQLPFANRSFDIVTASMFCHHFYGADLTRIIEEMVRVASDAVIVNDLHRHWAALWGYRVFSRIFLRGHVVRYDGAVSVRRGFVPAEFVQLASLFPELRWTVRRRLAFRLCLVGRRRNDELMVGRQQ